MKVAQMGGAGGHAPAPIVKDLLLLGGGHAHVEVLRSFGMQPMPGVRLTLVTKDVHTAYSGMLPGFVAQYYTFDECHIDLCRLAGFAQAQFICAAATRIDPEAQLVHLEGREPLAYDVLSIDVGITPSGQGIPGALEHATPVKPVSSFVERLEGIRQRVQQASDQPLQLAVVGGGAGGVELALSLHHYAREAAPGAAAATVTLLSRGSILASHPPAARRKFVRIMQEKGVALREGCAVKRVSAGSLELAGGEALRFDACLWCTQAEAPAWFAGSGLPLDERGFLAIGETLQSAGGPANVFAVGDCASCAQHPRPKAGVFAVRQGPPLAANLRRLLRGEPLQRFVPQRTFLGLITTGDRYAIATKGFLCLEGAYLWRWKDSIDRAFMRRYGADLPPMQPPPLQLRLAGSAEAAAAVAAAAMRCGGCGAKVGAGALTRVLARLPPQQPCEGVVTGLEAPDDAAVTAPPPPGHLLVQTVDFLPSFVSDLRDFGAIAANHALGDCHAMGAAPTTALATAVVPYGSETAVERALFQLLAGASEALAAAGCALVGGHSCEGPQACLGFSITGSAEPGRLLRKSGAQPGDALLLSKPLGSGVIMAAAMRGKALGRWVAGAVAGMKLSSGPAAQCLQQAGATACTDVTGFGLLGHLQEIAAASQVSVELNPAAVPLLPGAAECSAAGVGSSLLPQNARVAAWLAEPEQATAHARWPLLIDPQTGGGLLASVPAERAAACVEQLRAAGYPAAAIIGRVAARAEGRRDATRPLIRLLDAS